jgi:hypothetical protein
MKKMLGASSLEKTRRLDALVQNITSRNFSVDSGTAKYVFF